MRKESREWGIFLLLPVGTSGGAERKNIIMIEESSGRKEGLSCGGFLRAPAPKTRLGKKDPEQSRRGKEENKG